MALKTLALFLCISCLACCSSRSGTQVTIAINPWPGYEFLYLAETKHYFEKVGLDIKLLQLGSLSDARRAYVNGNADGLASTVIEAVQAQVESNRPLKIVLVPDYSNGGDVIIADKTVKSLSDLKGKTVGCEVDSLGIYLLHRALSQAGLSLSDLDVVNVEQMRGEQAMLDQQIDAYVSYAPVSVSILKHEQFHTVFSSAQIPNEIIDTVSIAKEILQRDPQFVSKLHRAWQMALDYYATNPRDALQIMSAREQISADDFVATLSELTVLNREQQKRIFASPDALHQATVDVCNTLVHVQAIQTNCDNFINIVN
ncbi:MAG: ABC transporter substrate-binding protein [Cellvibrionaceae bacterium]|nr:ABC transporter substrate-binding protein [Cellvibrionaceae bacterium]